MNLLNGVPGRHTYNLILDIEHPTTTTAVDEQLVRILDRFLTAHDVDSVAAVAETIFPARLYQQRGRSGVLLEFPSKVYPTLSKNWGTYAGRLLVREGRHGERMNPLAIVMDKLKRQRAQPGPLRSAYEVSLVDLFTDLPIHDPALDARRTLNQPCLVHVSFKLRDHDALMLTALYRSHYYVQRALGNLIGLAQLLRFVSRECGLEPGSLVCHSTFARLDTAGGWTLHRLDRLLADCNRLVERTT